MLKPRWSMFEFVKSKCWLLNQGKNKTQDKSEKVTMLFGIIKKSAV